MKLQEEIKALLEKMMPTIPAESGKIMAEATRKLTDSGIVNKALKQGDSVEVLIDTEELANVLGVPVLIQI